MAHGGGIGDRAGQPDFSAGENRREVIQRPFIAGQEPEFGLDLVKNQLPRGPVGFRDGPDQAAFAQPERVRLDLEPGERPQIEAHLDLRERQLRAEGGVGAHEADVLRDDTPIPAQAQAGELQIQAASAQIVQQRGLGKAGQPGLVEINQRPQHGENQEPNRHAEPAEVNPAGPPETALAAVRHTQREGANR